MPGYRWKRTYKESQQPVFAGHWLFIYTFLLFLFAAFRLYNIAYDGTSDCNAKKKGSAIAEHGSDQKVFQDYRRYFGNKDDRCSNCAETLYNANLLQYPFTSVHIFPLFLFINLFYQLRPFL